MLCHVTLRYPVQIRQSKRNIDYGDKCSSIRINAQLKSYKLRLISQPINLLGLIRALQQKLHQAAAKRNQSQRVFKVKENRCQNSVNQIWDVVIVLKCFKRWSLVFSSRKQFRSTWTSWSLNSNEIGICFFQNMRFENVAGYKIQRNSEELIKTASTQKD